MAGPSVWAVSDGVAGHTAQSLAVAQSLGDMDRWTRLAGLKGEGHRSEPLILTPSGLQTRLPAAWWPAPLRALPQDQREAFTPPWPDVFIATGRKTAPYTRAIRKLSNGRTLTVQVMNPKCDPSDFDLLVVPEHDGVSGENVISTLGAPVYFSADRIEDAQLAQASMLEEEGFRVSVLPRRRFRCIHNEPRHMCRS